MSEVQLFKAPTTITGSNKIVYPEHIPSIVIDEVIGLFFKSKPRELSPTQASIAAVNEMIGNNLFPTQRVADPLDTLAVLARQVPIILSEILETLQASLDWISYTNQTYEKIPGEFINGVADIIYTVGGLAARLGSKPDEGSLLLGLCYTILAPHRQEVMTGVCGEQMSKFISSNDIILVQDIFDRKGIEIVFHDPGNGNLVIKSAKDQVVDGEHYPKGKWLKGPHFRPYKIRDEVIKSYVDSGIPTRIRDFVRYFIFSRPHPDLPHPIDSLNHWLDLLNELIVYNFGEEWKMNLTKRDRIIEVLEELTSELAKD